MSVLIPIALLVGGILISTGTIWNMIMIAGITCIIAVTLKGYLKGKGKNAYIEDARHRRIVVSISTLVALFLLGAQVILCQLTAPLCFWAYGAAIWFLIMVVIRLVIIMKEYRHNSCQKLAFIVGICLLVFFILGMFSDIYEYITGAGFITTCMPLTITITILIFICLLTIGIIIDLGKK